MATASTNQNALGQKGKFFQVKPSKVSFVNIGLVLLCLLLVALSLGSGSLSLPVRDVIDALLRTSPDTTPYQIIWNLRLPRTLLALLVGLHFAISGLILQTVLRNPLADPGVVGVTSGSGLAIVTLLLLSDFLNAFFFSNSPEQLSLDWLPLASIVGGLASTALVISMSLKYNLRPMILVLNGVAIAAIANAIVMWLVIVWGGGRTETTVLWLAGSLYARGFDYLFMLLPWTICGLAAVLIISYPMSALRFEETQAKAMGVNIFFWRLVAIVVAVLFAASAISVAGPIGFIGLIVPHIARFLAGGDIRQLILTSALVGACLTLGADIIGRTLISPQELPVGALTTIIGIPLLLYLLHKQVGGTQ